MDDETLALQTDDYRDGVLIVEPIAAVSLTVPQLFTDRVCLLYSFCCWFSLSRSHIAPGMISCVRLVVVETCMATLAPTTALGDVVMLQLPVTDNGGRSSSSRDVNIMLASLLFFFTLNTLHTLQRRIYSALTLQLCQHTNHTKHTTSDVSSRWTSP